MPVSSKLPICAVTEKRREFRVNFPSISERIDGTCMSRTLLTFVEGRSDKFLSPSAQLAAVSDTMVDAWVEVLDVLIPM